MTSKELFRRLSFYHVLDSAAHYFSSPLIDNIYKLSIKYLNGTSETHFISDTVISNISPSVCSFISFERFTRYDFDIQVKYFKSFYSRCSNTQKLIVRSSGQVPYLLELL